MFIYLTFAPPKNPNGDPRNQHPSKTAILKLRFATEDRPEIYANADKSSATRPPVNEIGTEQRSSRLGGICGTIEATQYRRDEKQ